MRYIFIYFLNNLKKIYFTFLKTFFLIFNWIRKKYLFLYNLDTLIIDFRHKKFFLFKNSFKFIYLFSKKDIKFFFLTKKTYLINRFFIIL
jgi:hypothetical protein